MLSSIRGEIKLRYAKERIVLVTCRPLACMCQSSLMELEIRVLYRALLAQQAFTSRSSTAMRYLFKLLSV